MNYNRMENYTQKVVGKRSYSLIIISLIYFFFGCAKPNKKSNVEFFFENKIASNDTQNFRGLIEKNKYLFKHTNTYFTLRGMYEIKRNNYDLAILYFDSSLSYLITGEAFMYKADAYDKLGDNSKAFAYYNLALQIDSNNYKIRNNYGVFLNKIDKPDLAIDQLSIAIQLKSNSYAAYLNRAIAYESLDSFGKSINDLNSAIALNNTNPIAFFRKAASWAMLDNYDSSIHNINMAIALDSLAGRYLYNRALINKHFKKNNLVCPDYFKATKMDSNILNYEIIKICNER